MKQLPTYGLEPVDCGSLIMNAPQIAAIEKAVLDMQVCVCVCVCVSTSSMEGINTTLLLSVLVSGKLNNYDLLL